jgi:hypothetical protein
VLLRFSPLGLWRSATSSTQVSYFCSTPAKPARVEPSRSSVFLIVCILLQMRVGIVLEPSD